MTLAIDELSGTIDVNPCDRLKADNVQYIFCIAQEYVDIIIKDIDNLIYEQKALT